MSRFIKSSKTAFLEDYVLCMGLQLTLNAYCLHVVFFILEVLQVHFVHTKTLLNENKSLVQFL